MVLLRFQKHEFILRDGSKFWVKKFMLTDWKINKCTQPVYNISSWTFKLNQMNKLIILRNRSIPQEILSSDFELHKRFYYQSLQI